MHRLVMPPPGLREGGQKGRSRDLQLCFRANGGLDVLLCLPRRAAPPQGRPDGKLAKSGKKVIMKYVGKLKSNGKVFDQTAGSKTFSFRLGVGEVIKGWDRGIGETCGGVLARAVLREGGSVGWAAARHLSVHLCVEGPH